MVATLTGQSRLTVDITYNSNPDGATNPFRISGAPNSNSLVIPDIKLIYGTGTVLDANGAIPVNDEYFFYGTIAAGATKSIDLIGGADANPFGTALAFTHIKYGLVCNIGTVAAGGPDGISSVQVGPRGVANAWQGPWGGVGATVYEEVYWRWEYPGPAAGIAVTAGTGDLFLVKNNGAADVTAMIYLAGKK